jgi:hypothetical protein
MSEINDHARELSLVLLAFQNTVDSASRSCPDEVFRALRMRFIDPQIEAQERLLLACPNLIESVERVRGVLREVDR